MCHFAILTLYFLVYEQTVFSATVDQRQTGNLNVQIDLKNLQIVGLMKGKEEYVDYDYAYDYSEMTIKPPNGTTTTKKPLNVSEPAASDKDNTTIATTVLAELEHTSSFVEISSSTDTAVTTAKIEANDFSTILNSTHDSSENRNSTSTNCKKGFFRNSNGGCELKLQNLSNALLKMVKQKSKLHGSPAGSQP